MDDGCEMTSGPADVVKSKCFTTARRSLPAVAASDKSQPYVVRTANAGDMSGESKGGMVGGGLQVNEKLNRGTPFAPPIVWSVRFQVATFVPPNFAVKISA